MIFFGKRVLFLGAHPDDIELGCGALLHHIAPKCEVLCVTLSDNQKNASLKDVVDEHYRAMAALGVARESIRLGPFTTRNFPHQRQEILEFLLGVRKGWQPQMIFVHSRHDVHQDHNTITEEALRAFRGISVLGYDVVRSSYDFFPHFLVAVTEADVAAKLAALAEYKTYGDKYYFDPALTRSIMARNGAIAELPYAEGFDILRIVGQFDRPQ